VDKKGAVYVKLNQFKKLLPLFMLVILVLTIGGYVVAQTYRVQPGDSLYKIASRYGTSVSALQNLNQLGAPDIYPGQALQIGLAGGYSNSHTVSPGDSLYKIAQRYNVSVAALQKSNNLSGGLLLVGQRLTIPATGGVGDGNASYTVKAGDTAYLIAQRHRISLSALLSLNELDSSGTIQPGQVLRLPVTATGSSAKPNLSQSDINLLARLITAEAGGESLEGQVAVAATILNRLNDERYPETIPGVIYQINFGRYQYSPVLDGRINQPPSASSYQAIKMALAGWDPSNGANGFYNPTKTKSKWVRSHPMTAVIGGHVFFNY
jgi:N-acetylmuramoyl-L-alanine amidase